MPGGNQIQSGLVSETSIAQVGNVLSGTGFVENIALGTNNTSLTWTNGQNSTMLAFTFNNYKVSSIAGNIIDFTGGNVNFYTLAANTNLYPAGNTQAQDMAIVTGGTLWLSTTAAVEGANGTTLTTTLPAGDTAANIVNTANGNGFLDATGGPAYTAYHTGTFVNAFGVGGVSDISFTSDFSNAGGGSTFPISGSASLKANTVPEPGAATILASGVALLGFVGMRRRRKGAGAMSVG